MGEGVKGGGGEGGWGRGKGGGGRERNILPSSLVEDSTALLQPLFNN